MNKIARSALAGRVCTLITAPPVAGQTGAVEVIAPDGKTLTVALEE